MRILLLGLAVLSVGVSLTVVLISRLPQPAATTGSETPPRYSLGDILGIVSEAQAVEEKRTRHAMIHLELEQSVAAVWANEQSLREAARRRRELLVAHAPDYDATIRSMNPGASEEELYARSLMSLLYAHAKDSANPAAARARYAELIDQFRQEFRTENDLLPFDRPSPERNNLSSSVDSCP